MKEKILCTICARGGSKGVPNKNIRPLLGKPLIAYTIEQARAWNKAERIVVSTDSAEIARVAKRYKAEVPFVRPAELATDTAAKILSIRHALGVCEKAFHERYDIIVDLDPTSPLRKTNDIEKCLNIFKKLRPDSLFSVVKAYKNPYFNMVEKKPNGFYGLCKELKNKVVLRQRAPLVYSMNASIYFYSRDFILNTKNSTPISKRSAIYAMDDLSSFDIDRDVDFKFIEFLMKERIWKNGLY